MVARRLKTTAKIEEGARGAPPVGHHLGCHRQARARRRTHCARHHSCRARFTLALARRLKGVVGMGVTRLGVTDLDVTSLGVYRFARWVGRRYIR